MFTMKYEPVRNLPVARFYYQGSHSHPVRRTIMVIESNSKVIKGYELRCGNKVNTLANSPIRTFRRDAIASFGELRKDNRERTQNRRAETTLQRTGLLNLVAEGA